MYSPSRRGRLDSTPSSEKSSEKSVLNLMRLESAEKRRSLQRHIDKNEILMSSLNRDSSTEESEAWGKVQALAKQLVERLGEVPSEIVSIGTDKYQSKTNPNWIENVVREFISTDLRVLMQIYHGKKKDSVASTCAFLARITNLPQEKKANPAYVLQHFGLWDRSLGLEFEMPIGLLDRAQARSEEEEVEFRVGCSLFVAGVVVYGLLKLDRLNKLQELRQVKEADRSIIVQKLEHIAEQIDSVQRASTPRVRIAKRVGKSGADFKAPRTANLSSQLEEVSNESVIRDVQALKNQVASQSVLIESLLKDNKRLQEELLKENKKWQELVSERRVQPTTSNSEAEDKAEAFAKLATMKLHAGKSSSSKYNNVLHNVLEDDMGSELDGLSDISSVVGSELTGAQKVSPAHLKSNPEESTRRIIFNSSRLTTIKAPGSLARAVRMFGGSGVFVLDSQGNVFRGTQTAKSKDNKAFDAQFSFELVYPLWASKEEIENDSAFASSIRWPQNWPQMKVFLEEQLSILERDSLNEESRARALPHYDPKVRRPIVRQFYSCLRDIVKSTLGLNDEPKHPKHVQVFALISYFVYLLWTSAMVTSQTAVLTEDPMGIWIRHFDVKMAAAQGKIDLPMKEAVVWLGYGCKNKCKRGGMCPGFCLYCDTDAVVAQIRGTASKTKADSTNSRYETWKKETLKSNSNSNVSFSEFKRNGPKVQKSVSSKETASQLGEAEYFKFLEENQHYFKLEIPDVEPLNF